MSDEAEAITNVATGGLIGGPGGAGLAAADEAVKSMMPEIPGPAKQKVMPLPDDERSKATRRRSLAKQRKRSGRRSTILTALDEDKLGG